MSKKHFIELADMIREQNDPSYCHNDPFTPNQIERLADFCKSQNSNFNRSRWLDYIAGKCGPGGGAVKPQRKLEEVAE